MSEKIPFTDCVDLAGSSVKKYDGTRLYVSTGALDCDHIDFSQVEECTYENKPSRANLVADCGTILFAKMQGTKKTIVLDDETSDYIYSTGFMAVRAKAEIISERCLYHLVTSAYFLRQKDKYCSGATQKAITNKGLGKIMIAVPDTALQPGIAERLDLLDTASKLCQKILERFDDIIKSRFMEMFGDPTTNPKRWDKLPLGERCKIVTGNTPPRTDAQNYGSFLEWIKSDNINTPGSYLTTAYEFLSEKGFECCRYVEAGSVLMTCIAGSIGCIGNVGVADRRVAFNQQINAIVPDEDETMYIYWLMQLSKPFIQSTVNMALKGILSKSKLSALEFPFPPVDLQQAFSTFAVDVEKSKVAVNKCLQKTECLKSALMQQYFG